MGDRTYEILRTAVNIARNEQVHRLCTLTERLSTIYPNSDSQIKDAINAWIDYERKKNNDRPENA